ncbi:GSCOCG00002463001-RA-CDS [Cotesia congregata]|nr:GSCOCG00002463001-RA-CDS [Cotesia congregata]
MFSICSYVAETDEAINLVEGERVYVIEHTNTDWWFVKKHLTQEKGWVPAQYLLDEEHYTIYLQRKLHEKIDKLPVFEKPGPGDESSAPKFVKKLQPIHTPDGYTVQFECQVEGLPRPQITWFRQTAIIKPSPDFQIYYDEDNVATLIIREVFPEDAGMFTCVAKNAAGFASSTTELTVEAPLSDHGSDMTGHSRKSLSRESSLADILEGIPPTFSRKPKAKCVDENTDVILECRLVAVPEPEIIWYYEDTKIISKDNVVVATESDMHMYCSVMKIKKVTKKQEGRYKVVAKNREGEASIEIPLKVKTGAQEPPEILEPLKPFVVREGETVVLSTQIVGTPAPKITWLKDGKPLKGVTPTKDGDVNTLTIIQPKLSDKGDGAPEPPLFTQRFQELTVPEKGTFKLVAKVTGNPVPEVTWLRNNKPLGKSPNIKETYDGENITLEIKNADSEVDSGDYKCTASNPVGKASHGAKVTVDVPRVTFTKKLPEQLSVDEYKTLELTCETSHTMSTTWWYNDKEISGMDHREVIEEGRVHKLVIKKTSATDEGTYKCTVKNQSTTCTVQVKPTKPEFVKKLQDFEVIEKEVAILEVEITSQTADVIWKKDGEPLKPRDDKIEFVKDGSVRKLLIRSTSVHDEGEYSCTLLDEECSAEVTVVELPPEIITKMKDVRIARGDKAKFNIELTKGDALVRWFKDGQELQFSEHVSLSIDGKRQKLKIYEATSEDAGVYSCQVGEQTSAARLIVEEPEIDFIRRLPDVTLVPLDEDALFTIELSKPDVPVQWFKKGVPIKESAKYTIIDEGRVKKLIVSDCSVDDAVEYSAVVLNVKTSSRLKVEVVEAPPKISIESPKKYRVKKGHDVDMTVRFSAAPKPTDEWTVDGRVIVKSKRIIKTCDEESATLTIKKVEEKDVGDYTLKLVNTHGEASTEIKLIIGQEPGKPEGPLVVKNIRHDRVTIQWKPPKDDGGYDITEYIIEKCEKTKKTWTRITEVTEETLTYEIDNLNKDIEYIFRVIARNEVGPSEPLESEPVTMKSTFDKPGAPQGPLEVSGMTKTSFTIMWNPPESDGGSPIIEYNVEMKETSKKSWTKVGTTKEDITYISVSDLKTDAAYEFRITASNAIGTGPPYLSEEPIVTGKRIILSKFTEESLYALLGIFPSTKKVASKSPPSCPLNFHVENITSKSVTLNWSQPASTGGSELTGYVIEKRPLIGKGSKWIKVVTLDATTHSYCVENLKESEFLFRIFAENSIGLSTPAISEPVTLKTHANVPSPPTAPLEIRQIAANTVVIEWGRPESDGGSPLEAYKIAIRDTKKTMWIEVGRVNADIQKLNVRDLQEGHEYLMRIYARNEVGFSEPLESDEPVKIVPASELAVIEPIAEATERGETASVSYSTENTSSWLRDHNMDADISSYARARLLRKDEYFFRIWHYAKKLFK